MSNAEEKIQIITQTLKNYKKEIEELKERITSTTPLEFLVEREHQESLQVEVMQKEADRVIQLFDKIAQL
jgi:hypothetical protein